MTKTCKLCKKPFVVSHVSYCSDGCRKKSDNRRHVEWAKKRRSKAEKLGITLEESEISDNKKIEKIKKDYPLTSIRL